jgi:CheY-like chemotaxis protein
MPVQVLLIEDNRPDALLVREALRRRGLDADLREISDAETAARYIARMGTGADAPIPDIVIMDLNLPRGDGLQLLHALRNCPQFENRPVVVMTSSEGPAARAAAQVGNTRYFRKPLELDVFLGIGRVVEEALRGSPV